MPKKRKSSSSGTSECSGAVGTADESTGTQATGGNVKGSASGSLILPAVVNERLQVSVHTLALAKDCRTRLALRLAGKEDAGLPQPSSSLSMLAGTWGHKALAAYWDDDWEEALRPYEELSNQLGITDDRRGYANLRTLLSAWTSTHPLGSLPFDTLDRKTTEVSFVVNLGEIKEAKSGKIVPVDMIGYQDKLVRDKRTGRLLPLEHKFPGKINDSLISKFAEWDIQVTAYIVAAAQILGEEVDEAWVNAIEVSKVPSSDRKCPKHGVPYKECGPLMDIREPHVRTTFIPARRNKSRQQEFVRSALDICERYVLPVARAVAKRGAEVATRTPRDGQFTGACDYCEFRRWCLTNNRGRTQFDQMLRDATINPDRLRSGLVEVKDE